MDIVLPEIVAIGIYNSAVAVKNLTVTKKRKTTMFEIEIPIENGGISYIDEEMMQIAPDMIVCAKPGQIRHTRLPFKCYYVHFILNEGSLYDALMDVPVFLKTSKIERYMNILKKLCDVYTSNASSSEIILQSLILELIYILKNESEKQKRYSSIGKNNSQTIDKVIIYIKDNLQSDLSLQTMADYANFSPIYFHNYFKKSTGKTLHKYIEDERIKKAARLLLTTDWTLTRISEECGFSSQSYFNYAFKRSMNLTPREYAKKMFDLYEI